TGAHREYASSSRDESHTRSKQGLDVHTWNYTTQQIRQHAPPPTPPPAGRLLESPIHMQMKSPLFKPRQMSWHLNESMLSNSIVTDQISHYIQDYFRDNETDDLTPLTCWEAHKTVLRGQIIAICATRKQTVTQEMHELSKEIVTLEARHKRTLHATVLRDLLAKHTQLTTHLNRAIQRSYQHYRHIIHEHLDKCGRLLANLLKQRRSQLYNSKIKDAQQRLRHLPDQISTAFHIYYQDLCGLYRTTLEVSRPQRAPTSTDI
ncbi:Hypothetical predicted protein, partial [Pelobates cultripes]